MMAPPPWLAGLLAVYVVGTVYFVNNACHNIETVLPQEVIGQELALTHLTDAVCQHMAQKQPKKPLVISVHGPPGVGKTYTHLWLARTLYNQQASADLDCPGIHCRGYKVVYGLDYFVTQAAERLAALQREVVSHLTAAPDALLVVEEYDKLDCAARGLWRQLLQHPERANITSHRAVILMESNLGMTELEEMITQLGDRSKLTLKDAEQLLRDVVFDEWRKSDCESYSDTLKLMSLIDIFLPYLPLERQHMTQLVQLGLKQRQQQLQRQNIYLEWQPGVIDAIAQQVTYEGQYPLDGAKVVEAAMTRSVYRLIRQAAARPGCKALWGCSLRLEVKDSNDAAAAAGGAAGGGGGGGGINSSLKVFMRNNTAAVVQQHRQAQKEAQQQHLKQLQAAGHPDIDEL